MYPADNQPNFSIFQQHAQALAPAPSLHVTTSGARFLIPLVPSIPGNSPSTNHHCTGPCCCSCTPNDHCFREVRWEALIYQFRLGLLEDIRDHLLLMSTFSRSLHIQPPGNPQSHIDTIPQRKWTNAGVRAAVYIAALLNPSDPPAPSDWLLLLNTQPPLSSVVAPITALTRKSLNVGKWNPEAHQAFLRLKDLLPQPHSSGTPTPQVPLWFTFSITYMPGSKNLKADVLSRLYDPLDQDAPDQIIPPEKIVATIRLSILDQGRRALHGKTTIMVLTDQFKKAAHFIPFPALPTALGMADLFIPHVFRIHGIPKDVVFFVSRFWKAFCKAAGTSVSLTCSYHPEANAVRKYSSKKYLIIDLSASHNSHVPSLNSLIPSSDFSLHYATIDHAISLIKIAGPGTWLANADISSAFKVMPLDPDFWHLFGVHWRNKFFFAVRLTFGCRSSPKIFDTLAEALCWILLNNYRLPFLVHLLDDFLTIDFPHTPPARASSTLTSVFGKLGVPLATDKTTGPSHIIQFLRITLNSINFSVSMPCDKIDRISTYSSAKSCTKRELLSLLGHLNYAMRIIPQGWSFIPYLLDFTSSVSSSYHHVSLLADCKSELRLWQLFLANWNGISLFYDDLLSDAEDIQLFTDAAPSVSFGGYYKGQWFATPCPHEFSSIPFADQSLALFEIFPIVVAASLWGHNWKQNPSLSIRTTMQ
nr:PREDICTED: uncharacterized protein LOC102697944 [Lepisosteus oculatus]